MVVVKPGQRINPPASKLRILRICTFDACPHPAAFASLRSACGGHPPPAGEGLEQA